MNKRGSAGGDIVKLTSSKIITLCVGLGTNMLLARFQTLEEFGTFSQLLLVCNLGASLFMLGLPMSINYFLARAQTREEQQKFLFVYYVLSTVLSVILGGVLVFSVSIISDYFDNPLIRSFLYFLALFPWANIIASSIENVLVVMKRTSLLIVYRTANSIAVFGVVLLASYGNLGFHSFIYGYLLVFILSALFVYVISAQSVGGLKANIDFTLIKRILVFSIPMGLASVVGTINIEVGKLVIGRSMGTEELAIYTNASRELPVTIVATSVTAVLLPLLVRKIKRNDIPAAFSLWNNAVRFSFMCMSVFAVGIFVYAPEVIALLYSPKYTSGVGVFRIFALVLLLRSTYFGMILNALGKSKLILLSSILSLVLNAILSPVLFWLLGMPGPAWASFISIATINVIQLIWTAKSTGVLFRNVFPWKFVSIILVVNAIFGVVFFIAKIVVPLDKHITNIGESLLLGLIWLVIYFLITHKPLQKSWQGLNGR